MKFGGRAALELNQTTLVSPENKVTLFTGQNIIAWVQVTELNPG